jgi:hypothetical protein
MTQPIRNPGQLVAQYPELFQAAHTARIRTVALGVAAFALFLFGCWYLDFSLDRLLTGLRKLGWFVTLMIPQIPERHFRPIWLQWARRWRLPFSARCWLRCLRCRSVFWRRGMSFRLFFFGFRAPVSGSDPRH